MSGKDCRTDLDRHGVGQRILFTGPDGIGNYRVRLCDFPHSIGALSSEATGDLNYLFRPAPRAPAWLSKHCYVGGVGWGIEHGLRLNTRSLLSNTQIKRSEFRSAMEDRISQISWQVPPCLLDRQEPGTRGDQSAYENDSQNGNNQIRLRKRRSAQRTTADQSHFTLPAITGGRV
ncbi:hypothetical protein KOW79_007068 [Hemibagrus wyckioides]|uniref:Uncharacterized protein n=1 Tax=Hemibagrus wyckioides TaxID=337641 RepID=A0A9D3SRB1_9TELE|nr:uncharacterized protein C4orf45 homolog [Hemibagrus wyckioides]KAG7328894.1 hypothetical protein KOW79_007068 [Hemibagrus wyckioides]